MDSFRTYVETGESPSQLPTKVLSRNKTPEIHDSETHSMLRSISKAMIAMQMQERDQVMGTIAYVPPEIARGIQTDNANSWEFLAWALRGTPNEKIAKAMAAAYDRMWNTWMEFTRTLKQEYGIKVSLAEATRLDRFTTPSNLRTPLPGQGQANRLMKHIVPAYDAYNRRMLQQQQAASGELGKQAMLQQHRAEWEKQRQQDREQGLQQPALIEKISGQMARGLQNSIGRLVDAVSPVADQITNLMQTVDNGETPHIWREFLSSYREFVSAAKQGLPRIIGKEAYHAMQQPTKPQPKPLAPKGSGTFI